MSNVDSKEWIKIFYRPFTYIVTLIDYFYPKNNKLIIFGSNVGEFASGSPAALYEYFKNKNDYEIYFYTPFEESKSFFEKIRYIFKYIPLFFRAKYLVSSHPPYDFFPFIFWSDKKIHINTWHGSGLKSMFFADESEKKSHLNDILKLNNKTTIFLASSNLDALLMNKSFRIGMNKFFITGHPRNDVLLSKKYEKIRILFNMSDKDKIILYCPTYRRNSSAKFFPFDDFDLNDLNNYLEKNNLFILIRGHIIEGSVKNIFFTERILNFGFDVCNDVNTILNEVDILITDYSSLFVDFLILNRPMIFIPYDLEFFEKNRGLLLDYNVWTPGDKVKTYEEFKIALDMIISGEDIYLNQRTKIRNQFHGNYNGEASKKVFGMIDSEKYIKHDRNKLKILQISNSFYPCLDAGGVVRVVYEISKELVNRGNEVTVYTTDGCTKRLKVEKNIPVDLDGIKVYYFSNLSNILKNKLKLFTPYYLLRIIKKDIFNHDIIHIHEHRTLFAVIMCHYAKKYNIPYIVQAHGSVLPHSQKIFMKKIFDKIWGYNILRDASKVVALNLTELEQYKLMGVSHDKIEIIPNGINTREYQNHQEKGTFKEKHGINSNEKIILYLGRLHKNKGIEMLIKAFSNVIKEFKNVKLVIVGPDDGFLNYLKKLSETLNLKDKVQFVGPLYDDNKNEVYIDADVFVTPNYSGFPITFLEASIHGVPIVATNRGDRLDWIENKVGFIVEFDEDQLSNAILTILLNEDMKNKFSANGNYLARTLFDWQVITKDIEKVYYEIIG